MPQLGDIVLKLRLRQIGKLHPTGSPQDAKAPDMSPLDRTDWRDSSLDLKRGLDVIELSFDRLIKELRLSPVGMPSERHAHDAPRFGQGLPPSLG
jgi:hypothetical protein